MFPNDLNIIEAQSGPIGRIIACFLKAVSYRAIPDCPDKMFYAISSEISDVMISQVGCLWRFDTETDSAASNVRSEEKLLPKITR
jgi:hypothetical protein